MTPTFSAEDSFTSSDPFKIPKAADLLIAQEAVQNVDYLRGNLGVSINDAENSPRNFLASPVPDGNAGDRAQVELVVLQGRAKG